MKKLLLILSFLFLVSCSEVPKVYESKNFSKIKDNYVEMKLTTRFSHAWADDILIDIKNFAETSNIEIRIEVMEGENQTHVIIYARGTEKNLQTFNNMLKEYFR